MTVDPGTNGSLFFWFWPAQEQAATAPLLLWLQGGPGLSSVGLGALKLHGPLVLHVNKEKRQLLGLRRNHHTWARKQNVIYIDFPVGTGQWILLTVDIFSKSISGFSYSNKVGNGTKNTKQKNVTNGGSVSMDELTDNLYEFLQLWFKLFPEYKKNPFYAFGQSFGGQFVASIIRKIHDENEAESAEFK